MKSGTLKPIFIPHAVGNSVFIRLVNESALALGSIAASARTPGFPQRAAEKISCGSVW
jgi:hypothetical protein